MNTTTKRQGTITLETYAKEYVYHLDHYVAQDGDYDHPYIDFIRLGTAYPEGRYYSGRSFTVEFQRNLKDKDGQKTNEGQPYGGRVEYLSLCDVSDLYQILQAVDRQTKRLEIYSRDAYHNMITALRAAGYRRGIKGEDHCHIVAIE